MLFEMLREKWKALPDDEKKRYIDEEEKSSKRPELLGLPFIVVSLPANCSKVRSVCSLLEFYYTLAAPESRVLNPRRGLFCLFNVEMGYKEHHSRVKDKYKEEEPSILEMGRYVLRLDRSRHERDLQVALRYYKAC